MLRVRLLTLRPGTPLLDSRVDGFRRSILRQPVVGERSAVPQRGKKPLHLLQLARFHSGVDPVPPELSRLGRRVPPEGTSSIR